MIQLNSKSFAFCAASLDTDRNSERSFVLTLWVTAAKKKGFVPWLGTTLFVQAGGHVSESLGQDVRRRRQDKQCSEGAGGEDEGREEGGGELLREAGDQYGDHRQGDAAGGRRHSGHFPQRWALASRNWLLSFISIRGSWCCSCLSIPWPGWSSDKARDHSQSVWYSKRVKFGKLFDRNWRDKYESW